jgi:hypothetical protein
MFDVCVWYKLPETHGLSRLVRQYSPKLNGPVFDAHITIQSRLTAKQAGEVVQSYEGTAPTFKLHGNPYSTHTNGFSSIQIDLLKNGVVSHHHISLAYRTTGVFTQKDVDTIYIPSLHGFTTIPGKSLTIVQMNCHEFNPDLWTPL